MGSRGNIPGILTSRNLFRMGMAIFLIALPLLSLDAGISGDEPVHHIHAGYVNQFFSSGKTDLSALNTPETNLKYYGQVLDNVAYALSEFLNLTNPYRLRHLLSALAGFLLILFASLTARMLGGYPAAILTALFLFFSPRLLGHSFNNLKDIPFALGYMLSIWGLIGSMFKYPKLRTKHFIAISAGLALAFGTRAGGLLIVPIVLCFSLLNWIDRQKEPIQGINHIRSGLKLTGLLLVSLTAGYFIGILYWPFALQNPLKNPLEALDMMTRYEVSIRTVFNGEWIWSEKLPWYYAIKWIIISSPVVIIAGFVLQFLAYKKIPWPIIALLVFSIVFPLIWTIIQDSNLYGGWRHLIFIYPIFSILSALGWLWLYRLRQEVLFKVVVFVLLTAGMIGPLTHILRNHPYEYVYFNKLSGGISEAAGKFETDYYFNAVGEGMAWITEQLKSDSLANTPVIASNFPLDVYQPIVGVAFSPQYVNYYSRGKYPWDYAIFSSTYVDPVQLSGRNWPGETPVYEVKVDDVTICVVLKRTTGLDLEALAEYRKSSFEKADSLYTKHLEIYPNHETSLLYSAWTLYHLRRFDEAEVVLGQLLTIHPLSDHAPYLMAKMAVERQEADQAIALLRQLLAQNYKYLPVYEQLGSAYLQKNDYQKAAFFLERGYHLGLRDSVSVGMLVRAYQDLGNQEKEEKFRTILNKL